MCLPYLKFSDQLPKTHLIFLFCLADITLDAFSVILSGSSLFVEVPVYVFQNKKGFKQGPSWPRILGRSDFSLQEF